MTDPTTFDAGAEFDRQVANLIALGYPALAGVDPEQFTARLAPLRAAAAGSAAPDPEGGRLPSCWW
ncbi:hypothetical protein [Pseudonocardia kunmingensis]|uniref:hypothetical protein n=1 Tax=Pseudonocardia kunmingensis TaxID=630975 RepID=UPI001FE77434|nr:hypothetical protein [Pseudonocardia kunmingensis]